MMTYYLAGGRVLHRTDCELEWHGRRVTWWEWAQGMPRELVLRVCRTNGIRRCTWCRPLERRRGA